MRLFTAIPVPEVIQTALSDYCKDLSARNSSLKKTRWVPPKNIHLTLKFLGEIEESKVDLVCHTLELCAQKQNPFKINLKGVENFPEERAPKILWVGVQNTSGDLVKYVASIEKDLIDLGFDAADKIFKPHLTLARLNKDYNKNIGLDVHASFGEWAVKKSVLYQSILGSNGPHYKIIKEFTLHDY